MNRKLFVIITLQTLIIIVLFWALVFYGKDEYETYAKEDDNQIPSVSRVAEDKGATVITLSTESQQQSGIAVSALQGTDYQPTLASFGSVLNIEPLIELRSRYLAARADAEVVRASLANSQQDYQRLLALNRDNRNVSDRALQAAEAVWKADEAKLAAAQTLATTQRDNIRQQWGETLAAWAAQPQAQTELQRLIEHRDVLIQVSLPFETITPGKGMALSVEPAGTQGKAISAGYISPSPQTDPTLQGRTFYYFAPADNLRAGMRVAVKLAGHGKATSGVIVPSSAVVWYAGKAWVYQQQAAERFVRHQVSTDTESGEGWFNSGSLKAGDRVVTNGVQLLLSEEFKYQIKNENED